MILIALIIVIIAVGAVAVKLANRCFDDDDDDMFWEDSQR